MALTYQHFLFSLSFLAPLSYAQGTSGTAFTDRYYDCCKPSCGWADKGKFINPVTSCDKDDNPLPGNGYTAGTGCQDGGTAYTCSNQSPWAVNDTFSYGFAGAYIKDHLDDTWCCACYELTFTSGPVAGKKMVIQASNSGFDIVTTNRFTLAVPGGNTSQSNTCAAQYGVANSTFGAENQGVGSRSDCDALPNKLKASCQWRFDWMLNAETPSANYTRVSCPAALTNISGCVRQDEKTFVSSSSSSSNSASKSLATPVHSALPYQFVTAAFVILGMALL